MAINKVINKQKTTHKSLIDELYYVMHDEKIDERYVIVTGPFPFNEITSDNVYEAFIKEKELWNKDEGRMYEHNIISFHKDEKITPEQVLEIGERFVEKFFQYHQSLIVVHLNKKHLHVHIITNSVSFIDGLKIHLNKKDLEIQKNYTNKLCKELGFSVTEKGKHFDGTIIEKEQTTTWERNKYELLKNNHSQSYLVECIEAIKDSIKHCSNKDDFISKMKNKGWMVNWSNDKEYIIFENKNGNKVSSSNLSNTFHLNIDKESLIKEFIPKG